MNTNEYLYLVVVVVLNEYTNSNINKNCLCRFQDCGKLLAHWRTPKKLEKYAKAAKSYNEENIEI